MACSIDVYFHKSLTIEAVVARMGCNRVINLVKCDTGPKLNFELKDCTGLTPLTGVSAAFFYMSRVECGDANCHNSNEGHEGLSGVDIPNGKWTYILQPGDVSAAGTYFGELSVIYDDGLVETAFQPVRIYVRESCKPC